MNYFFKLIFIDNDPLELIYGFCAPTKNNTYDWNIKILDKKKKIIKCFSILNEQEKDNFISNIINKVAFKMKDKCFVPDLYCRPSVFSNISGTNTEKGVPVSSLSVLDEYWNLDKSKLMKNIKEQCCKTNGKALFKDMQCIFDILKFECGIDLASSGERLGNFEHYTPCEYADLFEIKSDKENGLIIKKKYKINDELIVNCKAENEGRWISDEIKHFPSHEDTLVFTASEVISHYKISIWNSKHGNLKYAKESTFMLEIIISGSMIGSTKQIKDPWTEELHKSSSNLNKEIRKIETTKVVNGFGDIHSVAPNLSPCRNANQEGKQLCSPYKKHIELGAFIPKTSDKKGEIDSFLKVKELIDNPIVEKAVLADPYFSVKSAMKILSRISSGDTGLEILMSLSTTDPDTTSKNDDIINDVASFIYKNRNMLHNKLIIKNILRNNNQAFHDRVLIRYLKDGRIDGFLLSNSLNSAGQFFPYIIAPLETIVCLETAEYLQNISSQEYQKNVSKNERLDIKVLTDYKQPIQKQIIQREHQYVLPGFLSGEDKLEEAISKCIKLGFFEEKDTSESFTTNRDSLGEIAEIIFKKMNENPALALTALGETMYHSYSSEEEMSNSIEKIPGARENFIKSIHDFAEDVEKDEEHSKKNINDTQFSYWAIMTGNAKEGSMKHMLECEGRVFYKKGYWSCLYRLLLILDINEFFKALQKLNSPMMLHVLIEHLALWDFNVELYKLMHTTRWEWMSELGAHYLWKNIEIKNMGFDSNLYCISLEQKLIQLAYIISDAAFSYRMIYDKPNKSQETERIYNVLCQSIDSLVTLCNSKNISEEVLKSSLDKVTELDKTSKANILYSIAQNLSCSTIKHYVLDRIISEYFDAKKDLPFSAKDRAYSEIVVESFILRYDVEHEKIIKGLLHWNEFYNYIEPYLKDRNYDLWNKSWYTISWEFAFLTEYKNKGYELSGKNKMFLETMQSFFE